MDPEGKSGRRERCVRRPVGLLLESRGHHRWVEVLVYVIDAVAAHAHDQARGHCEGLPGRGDRCVEHMLLENSALDLDPADDFVTSIGRL